MANAFDTLTETPRRIMRGDDVAWSRGDLASAYPTATHSLNFVLTSAAGEGQPVEVAGVIEAGTWVLRLTAAITGALKAGSHLWFIVATETASGKIATVDRGEIAVEHGVAEMVDRRSQNERDLEAIDAVIAGRITADVSAYTIDGRSVTRIPLAELRQLRSALVRRIRAANGGGAVRVKKMKAVRPW